MRKQEKRLARRVVKTEHTAFQLPLLVLGLSLSHQYPCADSDQQRLCVCLQVRDDGGWVDELTHRLRFLDRTFTPVNMSGLLGWYFVFVMHSTQNGFVFIKFTKGHFARLLFSLTHTRKYVFCADLSVYAWQQLCKMI